MAFHGFLQANTAVDVLIGPFVDDTDGKTAETALTLSQADIKLSKNGQALTQKSDNTAAVHDANGYYNCALDATDTDTEGTLVLIVHETGALPVRHDFLVVNQAAYASMVTAKDTGVMDVNVSTLTAGAITAATLDATVQARLGIVGYGTAQAATGTTLQLAASSAFADDELVGAVVVITGGTTGVGQARMITDYVGATDTATVDTWTTTPTGTITYVVFAAPPASASALPNVNVQKINNVTITGDGAATPFNVA